MSHANTSLPQREREFFISASCKWRTTTHLDKKSDSWCTRMSSTCVSDFNQGSQCLGFYYSTPLIWHCHVGHGMMRKQTNFSKHVNPKQNQVIMLVWNSHQCQFSHVNTPFVWHFTCRAADSYWVHCSSVMLKNIFFLLSVSWFGRLLPIAWNSSFSYATPNKNIHILIQCTLHFPAIYFLQNLYKFCLWIFCIIL